MTAPREWRPACESIRELYVHERPHEDGSGGAFEISYDTVPGEATCALIEWVDGFEDDRKTALSEAQFLASAPALYAALEALLPLTEAGEREARLEAERARYMGRGGANDVIAGNEHRRILHVIATARAALAAARGGV